MSKWKYAYEIYLGSAQLDTALWQTFFAQIAKLLGPLAALKLIARLEDCTFHFYLLVDRPLPSGIGSAGFMLKPKNLTATPPSPRSCGFYFTKGADILAIANRLECKTARFIGIEFNLSPRVPTLCFASLIYIVQGKIHARHLLFPTPFQLLHLDFKLFPNYSYKKFLKYLSSEKILPYLGSSVESMKSLLEVDTFPLHSTKCYLNLDAFDFAKHSLVLGSSGSGKSRFLSLFIDHIYCNFAEKYKVLVIDPHDALYRDLTTVSNQRIINFSSESTSLDLFWNPVENIGVAVELLLELFRGLMADHYNSRLERVLRFSSQLLLSCESFSFAHLRKVLLDSDYRNELLRSPNLPSNVSEFFFTDFNLLKTQSYDLAIAPIIAFLDEAGTIPALSSEAGLSTLDKLIEQNFLSVISLNQLRLGDKMTQIIVGLVLQQIFLLAKSGQLSHELIVVIDEVAVVEQPILQNFLAELRKYHVAVILAGQYLDQLSPGLKAAIFANATNYYLFRVSRSDANILTQNLDFSVTNGDSNARAKFLANLDLRECVVRLSIDGKLKPAFKAKTLDFLPPPYIASEPLAEKLATISKTQLSEFKFEFTSKTSLEDLMFETTTNRKKLKGEKHG